MPEKKFYPYDRTEEGGIEIGMLSLTDPEFAKKIIETSRKDQDNRVFSSKSDESEK